MKVSVITPAYNSQNYILRCISSVLSQQYNDFELIVVDDGSDDKTVNIVNAINDNRIRLISKKNGGLSSARNVGIENCSPNSQYVFFVDSDDTVDSHYISTMLNYASKSNCVICEINGNACNSKLNRFDSDFWANPQFLSLLTHGLLNSSCNKCYSLDIIRHYNLRFTTEFPEDIRFNLEYFKFCSEIVYLPEQMYNYIHRPGSVTNKPYECLYYGYMQIQKQLYDIVPTDLHHFVDIFIYPQYRVNTMNFLALKDFETPQRYLSEPLICHAFAKYKHKSVADWLLHTMLRFGWLRMANSIFGNDKKTN